MNTARPLWIWVAVAMAGCTSIGPGAMSRDRFDYMATVAETWKSQMLQNLVKLRLRRHPGVPGRRADRRQLLVPTHPYSYRKRQHFQSGTVPGVLSGNLGMACPGCTDRYPNHHLCAAGRRAIRSLNDDAAAGVGHSEHLQAGYPVDFVFRLAVQSVNGVDNRRVQLEHVRPANPEFYALLRELNRIQASGEVGVRIEKDTCEKRLELIFRPRLDAAVEESVPKSRAYWAWIPPPMFLGDVRVVPASDKEIAFLTRSILEVLTDLSSRIEVPEAHVTEHRVGPTPEADLGPEGPIPAMIRITSRWQPG